MSDSTPRLRIPELVSMQEANCVTWNEALVQLDAFVDLYLLGQYVNTPPANPTDGDAYLLGGAPTGAWSGYAYKIASCIDGAWRFYTPFNGLRAYVATTGAFIVYVNGTWTDWNSLISANEVSIASAATSDLGAAGSLFVQITGTTAITSFGAGANKLRFVRFAQALTLTHNATSLILLGGASRTTAAGDVGVFASDGSGNWRERSYFRAASNPGDYATKSGTETLTNKTVSGATISGTTVLPGSGRIGSDGRLALGTTNTSPYMLRVQSPTGETTPIQIGTDYGDFSISVAASGGKSIATFSNAGYSGNNGQVAFSAGGSERLRILDTGYVGVGTLSPNAVLDVNGNLYPHTANSCNLGSATYYWANGYIQNAWTVISDETLKTSVAALSDDEIAVAKEIAPLIVAYKMKTAVAAKGDANARKHCGWIAQRIEAAFAAHGLDPFAYGCCGCDPAMKSVSKTRTVKRPKTRTVTVEKEVVAVVDGVAIRSTVSETGEEPVTRSYPLVDASGAPVLDSEGRPRVHLEPVTEEVEETYEDCVPDTDETGAPIEIHNIRPDEVAAFALAGLAARVAALEAETNSD